MHRILFLALLLVIASALSGRAAPVKASAAIHGQDVNGQAVALNGTGHYTVVMYTNPDLEDASRKVTVALDSYRSDPQSRDQTAGRCQRPQDGDPGRRLHSLTSWRVEREAVILPRGELARGARTALGHPRRERLGQNLAAERA
jgi:hypothetical protein